LIKRASLKSLLFVFGIIKATFYTKNAAFYEKELVNVPNVCYYPWITHEKYPLGCVRAYNTL